MIGEKKRFDGVQIKDFQTEVKGSDGGKSFTGHGSVFGNIDSYNEVVAPGAFLKSISEINASGRALPVLWNHHSSEPIGKYTALSEDDRGLRVQGTLLVDSVSKAKEVAALVEDGIVSGLSIGYMVKDYSHDAETGVVTLKELKLREISIVTFPANGEARIETIKSKLAHGGELTKRELEMLLRDAGLSKSQAIRTLRNGWAGYAGEGDPRSDDGALKNALADLAGAFQHKGDRG
jgi:HK97 family phage prohead protease